MDNKQSCGICSNESFPLFIKDAVQYWQCVSCRTVFSEPLPNEDMVGGVAEIERNANENHIRIDRVNNVFRGRDKSDIWILDAGCGTGYLVDDLRKEGYNVDGWDAYNPKFSRLPEKNKYDMVTCIEMIEHTSRPYVEIDVIQRAMKSGSVLMIESSFIEVADQEGIPLSEFFYIAPAAGHSTIFSWHGLDLIMSIKGLLPMPHWNRHVRGYYKR